MASTAVRGRICGQPLCGLVQKSCSFVFQGTWKLGILVDPDWASLFAEKGAPLPFVPYSRS
jgi:hypothetical protein